MRITPVLALAAAMFVLAGCGGSSPKSTSTPSSSASASSGGSSTSTASSTEATSPAFIAPLTRVSTVASTVPPSADVNPYGIVMVPSSLGKLHAGELLVSNYNDKANNQGTGTTIEQISTTGKDRCSRASTRTPYRAAARVGWVSPRRSASFRQAMSWSGACRARTGNLRQPSPAV